MIDEYVDEHLGAEIFDDPNATGQRTVADEHTLGPEPNGDPGGTGAGDRGAGRVVEADGGTADANHAVSNRCRDQVHCRRADETGNEQVRRLVIQRPGGVALLEDAVLQHRHAVAHRHGLDLVVGHVDGGHRQARLQFGQLGAGLYPQLRVEVRQRFIHQVHGGTTNDRSAHRHALTLAAGQVLRLAVEVFLEVEDARRLAHPLHPLGLGDASLLERESHVLGDGELRIQGVVLEDHGDVTIARSHIRDVTIADVDRAIVERLEARQHPQRGRFSRP